MGYLRLAVAQDEAFCFYYNENLRELERAGYEIVCFSPLNDGGLPEDTAGIYIGGGYPEMHAKKLAANRSIMVDIKSKISEGVPVLAECGGYMYLTDHIESDTSGRYEMCGIFGTGCRKKGRLVRFGYVEVRDINGIWIGRDTPVRGHEFHYFDTDDPGDGGEITAASDGSVYSGIHITDTVWAGWPHLYLPGRHGFAESFVEKSRRYLEMR